LHAAASHFDSVVMLEAIFWPIMVMVDCVTLEVL
jgi:hypothetical protein